MTSSNPKCLWVLALMVASAGSVWAGLGEGQASIESDRVRMSARHSVARGQQYAVHELKSPNGSLLQQFVSGNGQVFAVRWNTQYKPDLSTLLGTSFEDYRVVANMAAQRGGIQRQFHHEGSDLVVQSSGHLHVFSGYAYRRSLLPYGLNPKSIGLG